MKYLLIGLMISIGWHAGKLCYSLAEEIIFSRLHADEWYAVLCKKQAQVALKIKSKEKKNEIPYKDTTMGFRIS